MAAVASRAALPVSEGELERACRPREPVGTAVRSRPRRIACLAHACCAECRVGWRSKLLRAITSESHAHAARSFAMSTSARVASGDVEDDAVVEPLGVQLGVQPAMPAEDL